MFRPTLHLRSFYARRNATLVAPVVALLALVPGGARVGAQVLATSLLPGSGVPLAQRVDSLYHAGKHKEALALLDERLRDRPDDYAAHVLAARSALVLGYGASASDVPDAKKWLGQAIAYGKQAMTIEPLGEDGRYMTLAAEGRLALITDGLDKARMAVVVDSAARSLLREDPRHAGAHNVLGRLYLEIKTLPWLERVIARHWLGGDLMSRATWDAAERELRRAVELQPERNLYYADLGALLVRRGRTDEAETVLDTGLRVPLEFPEEEQFRQDMRQLLAQIGDEAADASRSPAGG
jgi:tetratricopeptide (TPR) repeat protein